MIKISRNSLNRLIESFLISEVGTNYQEGLRTFSEKLNQYMGEIEDKDKSSGGKLESLYGMMAAVVGGVQRDNTKKGDPELIKKMKKLADAAAKERDTASGRIKRKYADLLDDIAKDASSLHMQYIASNMDAFKGEEAAIASEREKLRKQSKEKFARSFEDNIDMSDYTKETKKGAEIHMTNFKAHVNKMIKAYSKSKVDKSLKLVKLLKNCLKAANNAESVSGRKDENTKKESILEFFVQTRDIKNHLKTMQTNDDSKNMASVFIRLANAAHSHLQTLPVKEKDKRPVEKKSGKKFVFDVGPLKIPKDQKEKINYAQELLYIGLQEDGDPPKDGKWSTTQPLWERFCDKFSVRSDAKNNWKAYAKETKQKPDLSGIIEFIHLKLKGGDPAQ